MCLVSIIIPIYNVEAYIERCVRSLFDQSLKEIEYIFVDDYTSDQSIEILNRLIEEYSHRKNSVKIITHSSNQGVATARNTGLEYATGEYIGWVDPDDWVENIMFERLLFTAKKFDADIVWCNYYLNSQTEMISNQTSEESSQVLLDAIMKEVFMATLWNKLIKKELYVEYEIRFIDGANMAEDKNVLIKLLGVSTNIKYIPEALYHYNIFNNNSLTSKKDYGAREREHIINLIDAIQFLSNSSSDWIQEKDLILYKLLAKRLYLFSSKVNDFKSWSTIFPETNSYIFKCPYTGIIYKILGWMAARHWWLFIRIFTKIKILITKKQDMSQGSISISTNIKYYIKSDRIDNHAIFSKEGLIDCILSSEQYWLRAFLYALRAEEWYTFYAPNKLLMYYYKRKKNILGRKMGFFISAGCFDTGLKIYHYGSIIVNPKSRIGKNCTIHGNCCIGSKGTLPDDSPVIGDNVDIGQNAQILGGITIADGVKIGAGAIVTKSIVTPGVTVVGIPAYIIEKKG